MQFSPKHCPSLVCWPTFENIFWPYFCGTVFGFSMKSENVSPSIMSNSLLPYGLYPARLLCPWAFPGKNTGLGCHFLLQGIFPTQGLNLCLLHWRVDSLPLSHLGSPKKCPSLCNRVRDGRTPLVNEKPSLYLVESGRVSKGNDG